MDINGTGKIVEQFGPFERAKIGAAVDFVCVKYAVGFVANLIEQVIFKDELDLGVFIGAQRRTVRENVVEGGISCGRSLCIWLRFSVDDLRELGETDLWNNKETNRLSFYCLTVTR